MLQHRVFAPAQSLRGTHQAACEDSFLRTGVLSQDNAGVEKSSR